MPRKETVQPAPLESLMLPDGTLVEVRDDTCWEKGRGQHKVNQYEQKRDGVLEDVANDYLTRDGRKAFTPDYMATGKKFARKCEGWGLSGEEGLDDSALRKKLYNDIKKQINILESSIAANKTEG